MSTRLHDVVIVGAGPAGSMTALLLARAGLRVQLVDRAAFPRPKPCGDCLSAAATDLLEDVGLLDRVRAAGASEIQRWDIVAPDGRVATGRFPDRPALALERRLLDPVLLDAALEAGARFRRARVKGLHAPAGRIAGVVLGDEDVVEARVVVGADGLRSVVARALGVIRRAPRLRKVSLTAHVGWREVTSTSNPNRLSASTRHGEMHVLDGGCIGIAPAGPVGCNLTLVVTDDASEALREAGSEEFFRSWLRKVPTLSHLARADLGPLLASGPFDWPTRSPVSRGAALVGDAAGYYDPFTGQGMYQAMAGGRILAEALIPALSRSSKTGAGARAGFESQVDAALSRYATRKASLTRPARRVQHLVESVVSRPRVANAVLGRLRRARPAMDRLIQVTGDLRPPRSLISPAVASSLLFPPQQESP